MLCMETVLSRITALARRKTSQRADFRSQKTRSSMLLYFSVPGPRGTTVQIYCNTCGNHQLVTAGMKQGERLNLVLFDYQTRRISYTARGERNMDAVRLSTFG